MSGGHFDYQQLWINEIANECVVIGNTRYPKTKTKKIIKKQIWGFWNISAIKIWGFWNFYVFAPIKERNP